MHSRCSAVAADDKRVGEEKEVQGRFADYAQPMFGGIDLLLNANSDKVRSIFVVASDDVRQQGLAPLTLRLCAFA